MAVYSALVVDLSVSALAKVHDRVGGSVAGARLGWLLGVGQYAAVYAADHPDYGAIAVKILHPDLAGRADVKARFEREIDLTRSLVHPGILRVFDDGASDDTRYAFLERLDGESLDARFVRMGGRLPVREAHATLGAALDVMAFVHAHGVVHRDLSPKNVYITRSGTVYVLDFGIAASPEASVLTRSGQVLGTPSFMSPEQARGDSARATTRTDVWSLGAMAFRLLAGRDVHPARAFRPNCFIRETIGAYHFAAQSAHARERTSARGGRPRCQPMRGQLPHERARTRTSKSARTPSADFPCARRITSGSLGLSLGRKPACSLPLSGMSLGRSAVVTANSALASKGLVVALDQLGSPAFVIDDRGRPVFANALGAKLFERDPAGMMRNLRSRIAPPSVEASEIGAPGLPPHWLVVLKPEPSNDIEMPRDRLEKAAETWKLTRGQIEVLRLAMTGDANKIIAEKLTCAEVTIEFHMTALFRKARVENRAQLVSRFWML